MNKLPTIQIKGKEYVLIKDRVMAFHELYPNGMIQTSMLSSPDAKTIIFKAEVDTGDTPKPAKDILIEPIGFATTPRRVFTGHSQAAVGGQGVNLTAALENAETSAVGRALAFLGIGVVESIASADEVYKAINATPRSYPKYVSKKAHIQPPPPEAPPFSAEFPLT